MTHTFMKLTKTIDLNSLENLHIDMQHENEQYRFLIFDTTISENKPINMSHWFEDEATAVHELHRILLQKMQKNGEWYFNFEPIIEK